MRDFSEQMEKVFKMLKAEGLFRNYESYEDWLNKKYPKSKGRGARSPKTKK